MSETTELVKNLQRSLVADGARIEVDGIYGPQTRAAVQTYQRAHGLVPDGIVGPLTANQLATKPTWLQRLLGYFR